MGDGTKRATLNLQDYSRRAQSDPCFICQIVAGSHRFQHEVMYRDAQAIAWLNRFPTLLGYCLVASADHRVDLIRDFDEEGYLQLQAVVRRVAVAVAAVVPTERIYVLSLGSNEGNAHVHWHIAPLPPRVPYEEQQFKALMLETSGYIDLDPAETNALADRIRAALDDSTEYCLRILAWTDIGPCINALLPAMRVIRLPPRVGGGRRLFWGHIVFAQTPGRLVSLYRLRRSPARVRTFKPARGTDTGTSSTGLSSLSTTQLLYLAMAERRTRLPPTFAPKARSARPSAPSISFGGGARDFDSKPNTPEPTPSRWPAGGPPSGPAG
jgi:diadenosine tetraphosphate (Ap4A) HIT family hydrolase